MARNPGEACYDQSQGPGPWACQLEGCVVRLLPQLRRCFGDPFSSFLVVTWLGAPAFGAPLASYEPAEAGAGLTVSRGPNDPGLVVSWPVAGGMGGAPAATEGSHVLKMQWTGEADRKVEVRHDWSQSTFDLPGWLGGVTDIQVDVYIATDSALPQIAGIWDDVFGWTAGSPVPSAKNAWFTMTMNVRHLKLTGLNHIFALLFENLAGNDGVIYLDNLRLAPTRRIRFAGRDWIVKSGHQMGPGPNDYSDSCENVFVDANGRLHLRIVQHESGWLTSEVVLADSLGHGRCSFTVESRADALDPNEVLGLFTWDENAPADHYREFDVELSRWGDPGNANAQFVVQPWDTPGNLHRFNIDYPGGTAPTTHVMHWTASGIAFSSHYGTSCSAPAAGSVIETWTYAGSDNPSPGNEQVRLNLWLRDGLPPVSGAGSEVIISDFRFHPDGPADSDSDGVFDDCDVCPGTIAGVMVDAAGCPALIPGDFDRDGDVDVSDFEVFTSCGSRSMVPHSGTAVCRSADFDNDQDVDPTDFGLFQRCVTGPGIPASPTCAPVAPFCIFVDTLPALRTAIRTAPPGARICLGAGTYEVTESIDIARDDITIEGVGNATFFALAPGTHCPVFVLGEPVPYAPSIRRRGIVLRNLRVRSYRFPDPQPEDELCDVPCREHLRNNGITVREAEDCLIENVTVENSASGGIVLERSCRRIHIRQVESFGHEYDAIAFGGDVQDSTIEKCTLRNNRAAGVSLDLTPRGNRILGCEIRDNEDVGIFMRDSDRNCFTDCLIANNGSHGVYIADGEAAGADAVENAFVNNQYVGNDGHGIWQDGDDSVNNCETGGTFSGNSREPIHNSYPLTAPVITCVIGHACND